MCSVFGILDIKSDAAALRPVALEMSKKLRHRGPDWSGIYASDKAILAHERLAIVGLNSGAQPLYSQDKKHILAVNGEIYNHKELRARYQDKYEFQTDSDCEVILALYQELGADLLEELNGIFAFVLYDEEKDEYLVGRDHIGIIPLYQGYDEHGNYYVASEMKALVPVCKTVSEFPPGCSYGSKDAEPQRYYVRDWNEYAAVQGNSTSKEELTEALEAAVKRQLMTDVPYGVLLSGGLDSSITSAVAKRFAAMRIEDDEQSEAWWPQLHSFAVGLEGAPDLVAAREVADKIGTVHHEMTYTIQEGLDAIRDVIYHIETYDVTTIRASTPMYLLARKIKAMGIKMVLSGEGADEIFGGYLYFHKAPNAKEFHEETVRKLAMRLNPEDKMCGNGKMEKHILRECFEHYLPDSIAWRQKEQFSDGVGYDWIDTLKATAEAKVTDQQMETAKFRFPYNTPTTKEGYAYREIFEELFPLESAAECVPGGPSVACSSAKAIEWDESFKNNADPSGRAVKAVHNDSY
ncbi:asparagine synthase B [Vibrio fortis]|uniref:asparagine synthase B n=1 Tax=Vibrio fortis TaxID=212667 RepID=UPI002F3F37A2